MYFFVSSVIVCLTSGGFAAKTDYIIEVTVINDKDM